MRVDVVVACSTETRERELRLKKVAICSMLQSAGGRSGFPGEPTTQMDG